MSRPTSSRPSRMRSALAVVGAAAVLAAGADTIAYAATGDSLLLGKTNKSSKTTTVKSTKGPALSLKTKKSAPPLSVSSSRLVPRLNADSVDGMGAAQLSPTTYRVTPLPRNATITNYAYRTFRIPSGTYRVSMNGALDLDNAADSWSCLAGDLQLLVANDTAGYHLADTGDGEDPFGSATDVVTVDGSREVIAGCFSGPGTAVIPVSFTYRKINGVTDIAGTPFTPRSKSAQRSLGAH